MIEADGGEEYDVRDRAPGAGAPSAGFPRHCGSSAARIHDCGTLRNQQGLWQWATRSEVMVGRIFVIKSQYFGTIAEESSGHPAVSAGKRFGSGRTTSSQARLADDRGLSVITRCPKTIPDSRPPSAQLR
jgi:hypothetical protein